MSHRHSVVLEQDRIGRYSRLADFRLVVETPVGPCSLEPGPSESGCHISRSDFKFFAVRLAACKLIAGQKGDRCRHSASRDLLGTHRQRLGDCLLGFFQLTQRQRHFPETASKKRQKREEYRKCSSQAPIVPVGPAGPNHGELLSIDKSKP